MRIPAACAALMTLALACETHAAPDDLAAAHWLMPIDAAVTVQGTGRHRFSENLRVDWQNHTATFRLGQGQSFTLPYDHRPDLIRFQLDDAAPDQHRRLEALLALYVERTVRERSTGQEWDFTLDPNGVALDSLDLVLRTSRRYDRAAGLQTERLDLRCRIEARVRGAVFQPAADPADLVATNIAARATMTLSGALNRDISPFDGSELDFDDRSRCLIAVAGLGAARNERTATLTLFGKGPDEPSVFMFSDPIGTITGRFTRQGRRVFLRPDPAELRDYILLDLQQCLSQTNPDQADLSVLWVDLVDARGLVVVRDPSQASILLRARLQTGVFSSGPSLGGEMLEKSANWLYSARGRERQPDAH